MFSQAASAVVGNHHITSALNIAKTRQLHNTGILVNTDVILNTMIIKLLGVSL